MSPVVLNRTDLCSLACKFPGCEYCLMLRDYTIFATYRKAEDLLELRFAWPDACRISQFITGNNLWNSGSLDELVSSVAELCLWDHRRYHRDLETVAVPAFQIPQISPKINIRKRGRRIVYE